MEKLLLAERKGYTWSGFANPMTGKVTCKIILREAPVLVKTDFSSMESAEVWASAELEKLAEAL